MVSIYWQRIIKIFLFWSVIIFILLLILEDLKPYLVKVHFTPHWLVPIILIFYFWQIFSHDNYQPAIPDYKKLKLVSWLVAIGCWLVIFMYFNNFIGIVAGGIIFILVKIYFKKIKKQWDY
jgi:hypothetical protein